MIVESPTKARTIAQYLGDQYVVESSIGHVRDLPSSAAEIPAKHKGEDWARLGVDVEHDFHPLYIVPAAKKQQVTKLRKLLKDADELYLATDEDREGEAIAWHLEEVLKPKVPVRRMVFHEITRKAIEDALEHPREVDRALVEAQEARRILDRLYGYEVSPVLWRKVRPKLSAGRVQSAAIRLVVERERARMRFVNAAFWDVDATAQVRADADAANDGSRSVSARLVELDGRRVASGRDFDPEQGTLRADADIVLLDEHAARAVAEAVAGGKVDRPFRVAAVVERPYTQRPPAPFITSTLQQEAGRKLRFSSQRTMQVAQQLYENGYITYMRTDSTDLSEQALNAARRQVHELYGEAYVPDQPRRYTKKAKGAQEAHEAIRPAGDIFRTPERLRGELNAEQFRLYELVWMRTLASQMRDATGMRTNVRLAAPAGDRGEAVFAASGKVITFPGFLRAYVEGSDDPEAELEDQERLLPPLTEGQLLDAVDSEARGHETQPPARYTEASLVRELEERGIGRPSTYASIIQTVQDRGYVWKKSSALVPTYVAFAVSNLMERHFPELVDLEFTARMEQDLDSVAEGRLEARPWLHDFYFGDPDAPGEHTLATEGLKGRIGAGWEAIDPRAVSSIPLGEDAEGQPVAVRVGRYGPYIQAGDSDVRASVPDDTPPDELDLARALELLQQAAQGDQVLGEDPQTGLPIYLKSGRYGPYVQLGEDDSDSGGDGKPKRSSLWPAMTMQSLTAEEALMLLSYPRSLGKHPETAIEITVQDGRNGPYLRMGDESRSLRDHDQLASITLDEAVALIAEPRKGRRSGPSVLRAIGKHPESGDAIELRSGRFGPYVTDGVVNASLPKGSDPGAVTLERALELIEAREQRLRDQGKDPRAEGTSPKGSTRSRKKAATPRKRTQRRSA